MAMTGDFSCPCGKATFCYCGFNLREEERQRIKNSFIVAKEIEQNRNYPYVQTEIELGPIDIDEVSS